MKYYIFLLSLAFVGLYAEEEQQEEQAQEESPIVLSANLLEEEENLLFQTPDDQVIARPSIQFEQEKRQRPFDYLVYGHPIGVGFGMRSAKRPWSYEMDLSVSYNFIAASANHLYYYNKQQKWYTGYGIGVVIGYERSFLPYIPLTIGYWGDQFFADFGLALHPLMLINFFPLPIPELRVGFHF